MAGVSVSPLIPRSSSSCGIWGSRCLFSVAILFCVLLSSCEAKSLLPQSAPDNQELQPLAEVTEGGEAKSAAAVVTSGAEENMKSGSEKLLPRNLEESSSQSNSGSLRASAAESSTQRRGQWMIGLKPFYYKVVKYFRYWEPQQTEEMAINDVAPTGSTNLSQPNLEEPSSQSNSPSPEGQSTGLSEGATTPGKWVSGVSTMYYKMLNYFYYWKPHQTQATASNDVTTTDLTNLSPQNSEESSSQSNSATQPQGGWALKFSSFLSYYSQLSSYYYQAQRYIYEWTGSDDAFKKLNVEAIDLDDDDEPAETESSTVAPTTNPQEIQGNEDDDDDDDETDSGGSGSNAELQNEIGSDQDSDADEPVAAQSDGTDEVREDDGMRGVQSYSVDDIDQREENPEDETFQEIDMEDPEDESRDDTDEMREDDEIRGAQFYLVDDTDEREEHPEDETPQEINMENAAATGKRSERVSSSEFLLFGDSISDASMEKRLFENQNNNYSLKPVEIEEDNGWKGALRASVSVLLVLVGACTAALAVSHCLVLRKPIPSKDVAVDVSVPFFNEGSSSDAASASPHSCLSTDPTLADISVAIIGGADHRMSPVNKV